MVSHGKGRISFIFRGRDCLCRKSPGVYRNPIGVVTRSTGKNHCVSDTSHRQLESKFKKYPFSIAEETAQEYVHAGDARSVH